MNDMPRRKGSVGLGIVITIAAPLLFATLFMVLYGWKSWAINRQANLEYRRQVEARAMLEALKPQRLLRTWNSPWTLAMNCCSLSTTQVRCRSCTPTAGKDVPLAPQEGHSWVR
jgi:hypothetical protein